MAKHLALDLEELSLEASSAVCTSITDSSTDFDFNWNKGAKCTCTELCYTCGVDESKIESEFKTISFDVKFHNVQGKNYRCAIPKLNKEIVPEKCKILVKPKRVIITSIKASKGNWLDLHFKEDKVKPSLDKEKDPKAGLMDMMKNMYEEGDEKMKKTIAKAWTDARTGKTTDPLSSYR
ncbi:unnamed protein product [Lupinus luteus]|uniref:Calcyclin-binding protein n=1 Tax=Lupinus luteus TaxID=3873 RepID=A0AAV1YE43_LUPLU